MAAIVRIICWQSEADCAESKSDQMCEIRLTKLPYVAQQVGIVHFYAVAEIKGLSCRLRWMDEWRNLLTSTHVGHRLRHLVMWAAASDESLKFGVQGATATNWFSRVNGARDNGISLYISTLPLKFGVDIQSQSKVSPETKKSNMATRRPFWKWRRWKSTGSYPYI